MTEDSPAEKPRHLPRIFNYTEKHEPKSVCDEIDAIRINFTFLHNRANLRAKLGPVWRDRRDHPIGNPLLGGSGA